MILTHNLLKTPKDLSVHLPNALSFWSMVKGKVEQKV